MFIESIDEESGLSEEEVCCVFPDFICVVVLNDPRDVGKFALSFREWLLFFDS